MKNYFELKNEFANLLNSGADIIAEAGYDSHASTLRTTLRQFHKKELLVVAVGEAKRGKSSLLEGLIEEKGIFPIDVNVCTNIVTIVRYGKKEKIEVVFDEVLENGTTVEKKVEISREEIQNYASEQMNPNNCKNVRCINAEIPNDKLKQGVVFVDTPGVGSLNIAHAEVTYGFLPDADILLFVSDASAPLTETELKFLEKAHKQCKNIIFPVTKIDKFSDYKTVIEENRQHIHKQIDIDEKNLFLIPVSNLSKQMYLKSRNEEMYEKSNFKVLENTLWGTITDKRAAILINPFLAIMANEIYAVKKDLNLRHKALSDGVAVSQQITKNLNDEVERRKLLQDNAAKWRSMIHLDLNKLSTQINNTILFNLQQELTSYLSVELPVSGMANPPVSQAKRERILNKINSDIIEAIYSTKQLLLDGTTDLCLRINTELGLNMYVDDKGFDNIQFDPKDNIVLNKPQIPFMDKAMTIGRMLAFNSGGGAAFGSIVGGIIGGIAGLPGGPGGVLAGIQAGVSIGGTVGSALGGIKGVGDAQRSIEGRTVNDIRAAINSYITSTLANIKTTVSDIIQTLNAQLPLAFNEQLQKEINKSIKTSAEIQKDCQLSKEAANAKIAELCDFASKITELEKDMAVFSKKLKAQPDRLPQ